MDLHSREATGSNIAAYDVGVGNSGMIQELTERVESSVNEGNIAHLPFIKGYGRFEKNECKKRKRTPSRTKTDAKTRTDDVEGKEAESEDDKIDIEGKADLQANSNMEDLISDNDDFFFDSGTTEG